MMQSGTEAKSTQTKKTIRHKYWLYKEVSDDYHEAPSGEFKNQKSGMQTVPVLNILTHVRIRSCLDLFEFPLILKVVCKSDCMCTYYWLTLWVFWAWDTGSILWDQIVMWDHLTEHFEAGELFPFPVQKIGWRK